MSSSTAITGTPAPLLAPVEISAFRRFVWCLKREIWEYRSVYLAPAVAGALAIIAFLVRIARGPGTINVILSPNDMLQNSGLSDQPYTLAALLVLAASFLVGLYYCIDALHGERRDRSILFWKSLPVSDGMTVFAKAAVPLFVIPAVGFALTIATQLIVLLLGSVVVLLTGHAIAPLWGQSTLVRFPLELLYHLVTAHIFWYAPVYGWLLLVSACARRAPFLWATVPPVVIAAVEKIAFNTTYFAQMIRMRLIGAPEPAGAMKSDPIAPVNLINFLSDPALWIGLAFAAVFLYAASQFRRRRGPV